MKGQDLSSATAPETPTPLNVEDVTEKVAEALNRHGMFTIRTEPNRLGYIDTERTAVYLITVQHAEFVVNE